jgi:hypothetical protein
VKAVLRGMGLWAPGFSGLDAWLAGTPDPAVTKPKPTQLPPRLRRRTSLLTRMAVDALEEASEAGGTTLAVARVILSSTWGELETTVDLLGQLAVPNGPISPTAFHNSVHNTATGYLSIATGNRTGASAIAAGPGGLAMGMLEAFMLLHAEADDVLLVCADERVPPPFAPEGATHALAVAFHLASEPGGAVNRRVHLEASGTDAEPAAKGMDFLFETVSPVIRALAGGQAGVVDLGAGPPCPWSLRVEA